MSVGHLFDPEEFSAGSPASEPEAVLPDGSRVVTVLPDVSGLDKTFDYYCPPKWADQISLGSMVRVDLHGRRVPGWVIAVDAVPPAGVTLRPISRLSSAGPPGDILDLARWVAHRWNGPLRAVVKSASPVRAVRSLPQERSTGAAIAVSPGAADSLTDFAGDCVAHPGVSAVQTSPTTDPLPFILAAVALGPTLVIAAEAAVADGVVARLRKRRVRVGRHPYDWSAGLAGSVVVGQRSAVFAPLPARPATIIVLDSHAEAMQEERVPTWHAARVAIERSRLNGGRCVLLSPMSALVGVDVDRVLSVSRSESRSGWPAVELLDRRDEEPRLASTLLPPVLVERMRNADRSLLILNRKGRARMLACASCTELARSEDGRHLMVERDGRLESVATGEQRPLVCASCGSTQLKRLRPGVSRIAEETGILLDRPAVELTADSEFNGFDSERPAVVVGTEAALHRLDVRPDLVAFLDMDQELYGPRFRAGEQAMTLLVRAARLLNGRSSDSRIVVSTRAPDHPVLMAAQSADMTSFVSAELETRRMLGLPPFTAMAELSGASAEEMADRLMGVEDISVVGPRPDGRFLATAHDHDVLSEALTDARRSGERVRVVVDPARA